MGNHTKVTNLTSGCRIKRSQAQGRVQNCISVWVEENFTIRDLNLAERVAMRSEQAKLEEPLCNAEVPGIRYEPSPRGTEAHRTGFLLIHEAHMFCEAQ
jgi:hypothetical protein